MLRCARDTGFFLSLRRPHHAPAHDGGTLDRAEHQSLEQKADAADHRERGEHQIGVEEFLGVDLMLASLIVIGTIGFAFERLVFGSIEKATVLRWGMVRMVKG